MSEDRDVPRVFDPLENLFVRLIFSPQGNRKRPEIAFKNFFLLVCFRCRLGQAFPWSGSASLARRSAWVRLDLLPRFVCSALNWAVCSRTLVTSSRIFSRMMSRAYFFGHALLVHGDAEGLIQIATEVHLNTQPHSIAVPTA